MNTKLTVRQSSSGWCWSIAGCGLESWAEPSTVVFVVVNELRNAWTTVLVWQIEFTASILFDVVVLGLRVISEIKKTSSENKFTSKIFLRYVCIVMNQSVMYGLWRAYLLCSEYGQIDWHFHLKTLDRYNYKSLKLLWLYTPKSEYIKTPNYLQIYLNRWNTYTLVYSDSVYMPLVDEFRTTKQPSLSSCLSSDSALWRDISPTYHLNW